MASTASQEFRSMPMVSHVRVHVHVFTFTFKSWGRQQIHLLPKTPLLLSSRKVRKAAQLLQRKMEGTARIIPPPMQSGHGRSSVCSRADHPSSRTLGSSSRYCFYIHITINSTSSNHQPFFLQLLHSGIPTAQLSVSVPGPAWEHWHR